MLGWLVHLCIFRMKIILRHLRFKFQAQFILFFNQLPLGWLVCHPRAFADCPLLCNSPLRSSCSLHLLLLLSSQPDFRGGFITIWKKVFYFPYLQFSMALVFYCRIWYDNFRSVCIGLCITHHWLSAWDHFFSLYKNNLGVPLATLQVLAELAILKNEDNHGKTMFTLSLRWCVFLITDRGKRKTRFSQTTAKRVKRPCFK